LEKLPLAGISAGGVRQSQQPAMTGRRLFFSKPAADPAPLRRSGHWRVNA